jgi:hypothetical protein
MIHSIPEQLVHRLGTYTPASQVFVVNSVEKIVALVVA